MPTIEELERKLKKARELGDARRRIRRKLIDEKILRQKLKKQIRQANHPGVGVFGKAIKRASKQALHASAVGLKAGDLITQDLIERRRAKLKAERKTKRKVVKKAVKKRVKKRVKKAVKRRKK